MLLVEPPIVDLLVRDDMSRNWVVAFVPEETASRREKEQVVLPFDTPAGQRISLRMKRLAALLGAPIKRVIHSGDGKFSFETDSSQVVSLADVNEIADLSIRAYVELTDIAMTAQIAFLAAAGASA